MANLEEKASSAGGRSLLIGAILFGLVAASLGYFYLKSREAALVESLKGKEEKMVAVVVATQDLNRGAMITKNVFSQRKIPSKYVHDDAVMPGEFSSYEGQALTAVLGRGKTLLKSFVDREFPVDFSDTIEIGRRAMTVKVDEVNTIAGFLRPGNEIDIFVNIPFKATGFDASIMTSGLTDKLPPSVAAILPPLLVEALESGGAVDQDTIDALMSSSAPSDIIMPVMQKVRVLATGRDPYRENLDKLRYPQARSERSFSTITIDVSPEQAALLSAAEDKGDLLAYLRNRDDTTMADFSGVSADDLFGNASKMAAAAIEQRTRLSVPSGTDAAGNLVDADGNTILSAKQLADAGYTMNANGEIIDADGNVVDPRDIVVSADGAVIDKKALAAAGYTVNAKGQIVDANGNVVDANDLVISDNGTVLSKADLAAAGLSVNENGEIVDESGRVISPNEIVRAADGSVITKEQLLAAGLSINENGDIVDADGNIVDPKSMIVAADGTLLTTAQLAEAGLSINENGEIVDANGNVASAADIAKATGGALVVTEDGKVFTKGQLAAAGLSINENGEIVDANGNVVDPNSLAMTSDGKILSTQQLAKLGLSVNESGDIVDANGRVVDPDVFQEDRLAAAGLSINENGEIVDASGNVVDPSSLAMTSDGKILSTQELAKLGLSVNENGEIVDASGRVVDPDSLEVGDDGQVAWADEAGGAVDLIIGGDSTDGVAKATLLPTSP